MSRKKLMAANWKMFKTPDQAREFFTNFLPMVADHSRDEIAVCPPYICPVSYTHLTLPTKRIV